jgi:opacity protein-like surface antigen
MSKIFALALFFSLFAKAQTEKGTVYLAGNSSITFSIDKTTNGSAEIENTNFDINPSLGYFVKDRFFLGISGLLDFSHVNNNQSIVTKSTLIVLMPTLGYYFPLEGKLKPFLSGGVGLAHLKEVTRNNFDPIFPDPAFSNNETIKFNGYAFAINGGLSYFISNHFSLDAQISYNQAELKQNEAKRKVSGFGLQFGFSIFIF